MSKWEWWTRIGLVVGPLGLVGCGKTCEGCRHARDDAWPAGVFMADRLAVREPLAQQAANGAVVYSTLFNYYFLSETVEAVLDKDGIPTGQFRTIRQPTPQLTPWGKELLNRLARHANGQHLAVHVQVANDLVVVPEGPAALGKGRTELTSKRVHAVRDYLATVRPDLSVTVEIVDPDIGGVSGREGRAVYDAMLRNPPGSLSSGTLQGAENVGPNVQFGGSGGGDTGGGGPNPPSSAAASGSASSSGSPGGLAGDGGSAGASKGP